jgi:hypothetical protein
MSLSFDRFFAAAVGIAIVSTLTACGGNEPAPSNPTVSLPAAAPQLPKRVTPLQTDRGKDLYVANAAR